MKTCNIALGFLSLSQNSILAATRPIPDIESDIDTKRLRGSTKNPTRSNENVALRNRAGTRMLEGDNYEDGINYKEVGNYYDALDGTYEEIENEYYDQYDSQEDNFPKNGDNYTVDGNEENYDYYYHNETEYYNDYEEIYYDEMLKNNTDYPKEEEKQEMLFSDGNFDINTPLQAHGSFDELEEQEEIDEEILLQSTIIEFDDDFHTTPLFSNHNQCDKHIDLCEDGSNCSGLKQVFLELCFKPDEKMTDCTSDCSLLFAQLKIEAEKQGKAIECVEYLQKLPKQCVESNKDENDFESLSYCPSENDFTNDLQPGELESISCIDLYPSGIFGKGSTYRYCMLGGDAIITNSCQIHDESDASSRRMTSVVQPIVHRSLGRSDIKKGAESANAILKDASTMLKNAGEAGVLLENIGKLSAKLGPAFQAIGIVFDIINLFTGDPESAELKYMKQQFAIVNEKLDLLEEQLTDVETRLTYEIFKSQYQIYEAKLNTCGVRLRSFQTSPTMNAGYSFKHGCCLGDRSPLTFLHWMSENVLKYLDDIIKAKEYKMDTIVNEMQAIIHSTTIASYYHATCSGFDGLDYETLDRQIQVGVDRTKVVLNTVTEKIKALPNDYINIQLRKDIVHVVRTTTTTDDCSLSLRSVISDKMKGWRYRPWASAYCYNPVSGWEHHAVSNYSYKDEKYGFFKEFRIDNKFSVGVDWTYKGHAVDTDVIKNSLQDHLKSKRLMHTIGSKADYGIKMLREIVGDELKKRYCLNLRNIAYVGWGNGARGHYWVGHQYWINIEVPEYQYYRGNLRLRSTHQYSVIFSAYDKPACTPNLDLEYPVFPNDFKWSSAGVPSGYDCIQILESADPHTWNDNYFCWKHGTKNPGMKWSSAGPISNMRCTQIHENADPHTWHDNYLCVPHSSNLNFSWSSAGPIKSKNCIQWHESADPHTWNDNFLCDSNSEYPVFPKNDTPFTRIEGTLVTHQKYRSPNGQFALVFQGDGNLVLYGPNGAEWASNTVGRGDSCKLQGDGNLVIYKEGKATWASHTHTYPGAFLSVLDNGCIAIYDKNSNKTLRKYC